MTQSQSVHVENGFAYGTVGADIHVFGDGVPVYLLQRWRAAAQPDDGFLRELPSRMLNARFGVVEFTGRAAELAALRRWRDEGSRLAVRWLHAPGGQGKTRLADRFADECVGEGWQVATATHGPGSVLPPPGSQDLSAAGDTGTLLVVDYADRWPLSHLLWLLSNALLHRAAGRARVLLLARSDDTWPAVRAALANQQAGVSAQFLEPLPDSTDAEADADADAETEARASGAGWSPGISPRTEMFAVARDSFAARYGIPAPAAAGIDPPGPLSDAGFGLTLGVHMAALVAVDARAAGRRPPADLAGLTSYLLDREHLHWARLHGDAGDAGRELTPAGRVFTTPPDAMNRTVFSAALTGSLAPVQGRELVGTLTLGLPAERVLADHAVCYPPADPDRDTVLEPLYPDRLSEDFLALTLPGHSADYPAQRWAGPTLATLLPAPTAWTPRAVTFLAAAAQRWPHVGPGHLYPLLARAPQLAVAAGSAALSALASLDDIAPELLEAVSEHFTSGVRPDADLDPGMAAVSVRLLPHRLANAEGIGLQGTVQYELGIRLYHAGRLEESAAATEAAVRDFRAAASDPRVPPEHRAFVEDTLAGALTAYGVRLTAVGRRAEALVVTEESVGILRRLAALDDKHLPRLAKAVLTVGHGLVQAERWADAAATSRESVDIHRKLVAADPAYESELAGALVALGMTIVRIDGQAEAVTATQEGVDLLRGLVREKPAAYTPALANALTNLSTALAHCGRGDEAIDAAQESAALYRQLATANPQAYEDSVANVLAGLGQRLGMAGQLEEAAVVSHEAVAILRRLSASSPDAHAHLLAESLGALSTVLGHLQRLDDAIAASDECVAIRRRMAEADHGFTPRLAFALINAAMFRAVSGEPRLLEAAELFVETAEVRARQDPGAADPAAQLYDWLGPQLADELAAEGHADAADRVRALLR